MSYTCSDHNQRSLAFCHWLFAVHWFRMSHFAKGAARSLNYSSSTCLDAHSSRPHVARRWQVYPPARLAPVSLLCRTPRRSSRSSARWAAHLSTCSARSRPRAYSHTVGARLFTRHSARLSTRSFKPRPRACPSAILLSTRSAGLMHIPVHALVAWPCYAFSLRGRMPIAALSTRLTTC
jgi:hypothetical protein